MKYLHLKTLLFILPLWLCMNALADEVITVNGVKYSLYGTEAKVTGYDSSTLPANVSIPNTVYYNGQTFNVTKIGDNAFYKCSIIESLVTAENVASIGYCAFYNCSNLESIDLKGVVTIGYSTYNGSSFSECNKLAKANLGSKLSTIDKNSFRNCSSLKYIVIPATCTSIHSDSFDGCSMLQSIIYLGTSKGQCGSNANIYTTSNMVTWSNNTFTYNGKRPSVTYTNNLPNGFYVASCSMPTLEKDAGSYSVNVPFVFYNSDMSFSVNIPYQYVINKVPLTVTVNNRQRSYGDSNPTFTANYSGFVNNETSSVLTSTGTYSCSATERSNVGTYPITLTGVDAKNYTITINNGTLTVTKASLSARPNDIERTYGAANPTFTISYTGLKNNESAPVWVTAPTVESNATKYTEVGEYPITIVGGEPKNYTMTTSQGVLTISKADLKITAQNQSRLYYEDNPTLTYQCSGFVNGEDVNVLTAQPTITTNATKQSDAGTYTITVKNASSKNYSISYVNGTMTIGKRTLSVTTDNYTRAYKEPNPSFILHYSGFVNDEDESVLLILPTASTTATIDSNVGTYNITISGGAATNYDFRYYGGTMTIEKAYQTISWDQDFTDIERYEQIELTATASSGLAVSYVVGNTSICSVVSVGNKRYLDCFGEGETTIYAIQNGNSNYWSTTKIYKAVRIKSSSPVYDPNNQLTMTTGLTLAQGGHVWIPISMKNERTVVSLQFELELPDGLSVETNSSGGYQTRLSERSNGHTVSVSKLSNGNYQFVILAVPTAAFEGNNGTVLEVLLTASKSMADNNYELWLKNIEFTAQEGNSLIVVKPANYKSEMNVIRVILGDVNGDGYITVTDATSVVSHILQETPQEFIEEAADVNHDGRISVTDAAAIVRIILDGGQQPNARYNAADWLDPQ